MKRRIYRLKWDKIDEAWTLFQPGGSPIVVGGTKAEAEAWARLHCRYCPPSQLLIYTKAGRIGKGGRYEASYGCDSKRRKG